MYSAMMVSSRNSKVVSIWTCLGVFLAFFPMFSFRTRSEILEVMDNWKYRGSQRKAIADWFEANSALTCRGCGKLVRIVYSAIQAIQNLLKSINLSFRWNFNPTKTTQKLELNSKDLQNNHTLHCTCTSKSRQVSYNMKQPVDERFSPFASDQVCLLHHTEKIISNCRINY